MMSSEIINILGSFVKALSSARDIMLYAGLVIVGAVMISYTIYGAYKFGVYALKLKPHYFALVMFSLGLVLILLSSLIPG
ncbi:MAG TPA: hypothetical protein VNL13_05115 [Sulfolobales archaeon]|nr:hypothetical protein [Sulfolobales archaeon]